MLMDSHEIHWVPQKWNRIREWPGKGVCTGGFWTKGHHNENRALSLFSHAILMGNNGMVAEEAGV